MSTPTPRLHVRASQVLRARKIWIAPILIASVFVAVMATVYVGSVINPIGHLHGLPVIIVDQDSGAVADGQHINVGASLTDALERTSAVTSRLKLTSATQDQAEAEMDKGGAYATLVIPPTLTRSVLLAAGVTTPGVTPPATAEVQLQENTRLGTLGVNLANGVLTPALAQISPQIGSKLKAVATPAAQSNPVLAGRVADPITVTTASYRPLPDHSALGLSAFYIALLGLIAGFVGATLINSSVDTALGYASSQLGPRFTSAVRGDQPAPNIPRQVGDRGRRRSRADGHRSADRGRGAWNVCTQRRAPMGADGARRADDRHRHAHAARDLRLDRSVAGDDPARLSVARFRRRDGADPGASRSVANGRTRRAPAQHAAGNARDPVLRSTRECRTDHIDRRPDLSNRLLGGARTRSSRSGTTTRGSIASHRT